LSIIAAIAITAAGSGLINSAITNPSTLTTVKSLREAGYIISFAVSAIVLIALIATHFIYGLAAKGTVYLLIPIFSVFVVGIYRVIQVFTYNPTAPVRSPAAFWVLQILFEL
jgi:hypothetical protein